MRPAVSCRVITRLRFAVLMQIAVLMQVGATAQTGVRDDTPLSVTQVAPGVYVHIGVVDDWLPRNGGDIANLGFVVGSRCVAVIDTGGTPELGRRWRATVERTTPVPICYVIDSHAHPDHVLGNAAFLGDQTRFVASARFNAALAAREGYFLHALERDFGMRVTREAMVYPTVAVDGMRELELGDRVLVAQSWPTAHTDNDLTVYDRNTRTLFASDLLFVEHIPVVDGSLRGWLRALPQLAAIDAARIVPGHGPVQTGGGAAWQPEQAYLEALLRETRAAVKAGKTLSQAVDSVGVPAASLWKLGDEYHRRNVTAAFAELEWEE